MRTHYVAPFYSNGSIRLAACGVICYAGGGHDGKSPMGTTRLLSVRCRACVMALRAERNYLLTQRGEFRQAGQTYGEPSESMKRRQEGPER